MDSTRPGPFFERNGSYTGQGRASAIVDTPEAKPVTSDSDGLHATSGIPPVITHLLEADASVPNNARLPLLVYPAAVGLSRYDRASVFEQRFCQ